jgi:hypothetical protein
VFEGGSFVPPSQLRDFGALYARSLSLLLLPPFRGPYGAMRRLSSLTKPRYASQDSNTVTRARVEVELSHSK